MEAAYENVWDVGPMERLGYFEEAYNGKDRGYGKVGQTYYDPLPVPKLIIRRRYVRRPQQPPPQEPKMRALFDYAPGNLPLDLMSRVPRFMQGLGSMNGGMDMSSGRTGGIMFTMNGQPGFGMNYNFNNNYGNRVTGSGSIKDDIDQTGVEMSPNRANGW